jgi:hypothetical protein
MTALQQLVTRLRVVAAIGRRSLQQLVASVV